ncbi:hypothetical protein BJ546DRAFT_161843 [Cryomyces antarcticus]
MTRLLCRATSLPFPFLLTLLRSDLHTACSISISIEAQNSQLFRQSTLIGRHTGCSRFSRAKELSLVGILVGRLT